MSGRAPEAGASNEASGSGAVPDPTFAGVAATDQTHGRLQELESLTDSALAFLSLEEMLVELLERIRAILGVDTAAILLLDEARNVLVARAARGLEEEVRQGVQVPLARGFAGRVAAEGRPIVIEDLDRADVYNPILRMKGLRSLAGVPVHVEGRVIGVMHVGSLTRRLFGEEDVLLLQLAADRAALAIDHAKLTEQKAVTEIMQRTVLPEALPEIPGLRFGAKYLPAGSGVKIGGDWYDVFPLANGHVAVVIGDVVGSGVMAASVMAEIRTALRAYLTEGHDLVTVMSLLNELMCSMGRDRSATAALLDVDLEREQLSAVSAGHLPPVMVDPDGEAFLLEGERGMPLGLIAGQRYPLQTFPFAVGSVLVLCTDGLVERRGEPLQHGLERLMDAARAACFQDQHTFADSVYGAFADGEAELEDDVALLAIESLPLGSRMELTLAANPAILAGLRRTVGRWLICQGASEAESFDVTLGTSEAASNAIEHAYGPREATFTVECLREGEDVRVVVRDAGTWRETRPYGGGRGLDIMRALVDSAIVECDEGGTSVTLVKRLESGS